MSRINDKLDNLRDTARSAAGSLSNEGLDALASELLADLEAYVAAVNAPDEDEDRHVVGYDEDGDPIYETGPDDGGLVHV